jgi:ADP-ribosylglycohydrolase
VNRDRRTAAVASLRGLAVGDALGSCFFVPANLSALTARTLPRDEIFPWTDDAEMACSVFAVLDRHGGIDQDALAASFAAHHDFDRGYGPGVNRMLRLIRQEGASWRELAAVAFDGRGSWGNGRATSAPDTVPFCVWVAAKHPRSFVDAFWAAASAGGDVDTNCAIVGGIIAARTGVAGIPAEWLRRCEPLPAWAGIDAQS